MLYWIIGIVGFSIFLIWQIVKTCLYNLHQKAKGKHFAAKDKADAQSRFIYDKYKIDINHYNSVKDLQEELNNADSSIKIDEKDKGDIISYSNDYFNLKKEANNLYKICKKYSVKRVHIEDDSLETFCQFSFWIGLIILGICLICFLFFVFNTSELVGKYKIYTETNAAVYDKELVDYNTKIKAIQDFYTNYGFISVRTKKQINRLKLITDEQIDKIRSEKRINTVPYLEYQRNK